MPSKGVASNSLLLILCLTSRKLDILTVLVGPDEIEYTLHKDLLYAKSPYFLAALKDHWKEGLEGRLPLSNDDPAVLALYFQWVYRGRILSSQDTGDTGGNREEISLLVDAYVFGEKLQDRDFRDTVIDSLIHAVDTPDAQDLKWCPTSPAIGSAYICTSEGSPLRSCWSTCTSFTAFRNG